MILAFSKEKFRNAIATEELMIQSIQSTSPTLECFISKLLERFDNIQLSEYDIMVISTALGQTKYDMLKIELALAANTSQMANLCKLGFGRLFSDLQYVNTNAMALVKPQEHSFGNIFGGVWDVHSVCRSIVPFIYNLDPIEFNDSCDKIYDFQLGIYNKCLDATYRIKKLSSEYFSDDARILVDKILRCLYEDAIGSETRGVETFFNNFVKYMTTNQWYFDGAQTYDEFVTILDVMCNEIMNEFEIKFSHSPIRIAIYMRFKAFRYRVNPHYDEDFYKIGGAKYEIKC